MHGDTFGHTVLVVTVTEMRSHPQGTVTASGLSVVSCGGDSCGVGLTVSDAANLRAAGNIAS